MEDRTVLNPSLLKPQNDEVTVLNREVIQVEGLKPGTFLRNGLTVLEKMDVLSGEADLYVCEKGGKKCVLKHYRQQQSLKEDVREKLLSIRSPYVARIYSFGTFLERNYEIDSYYPLGSLDGKKVPYESIKEKVIPQLNEGLHILHQNALMHKDLKPSNIMLRSKDYDIALIDFGISSIMEEDSTVLLTKTGMTPQYSAPETLQSGVFMEESDYYSMGVTLCALYLGHSPFHGMGAQEILRYSAIQRIPLPEDMPVDLQELILGLTYGDLTNRKDKDNPNRRWTYLEVKKWIAGERQAIPGNPNGAFIHDAEFGGRLYPDMDSLLEVMIAKWELGKRELINGNLAKMFRACSPICAPLCASAQSKAKAAGGYEDLSYFYLLYELMPQKERFVWKGRAYENTVALGNDMLSRMQSGDTVYSSTWTAMLRQKILSNYAAINKIDDNPQLAVIRAAEATAARIDLTAIGLRRLHYQIAYHLSGQKKLLIGGNTFYSVEELSAYMQSLATESFTKFRRFAHTLMISDRDLDPQFETWLEAQGHYEALDAWRQMLD